MIIKLSINLEKTKNKKNFKIALAIYKKMWYNKQAVSDDGVNKVGIVNVGGTPVPIPNTEVKLNSAENTWTAASREDRKLPTSKRRILFGIRFCFLKITRVIEKCWQASFPMTLVLFYNTMFGRFFKEVLIKSRLTAWHAICLHIFRHITQILLDLHQQACVGFRQWEQQSCSWRKIWPHQRSWCRHLAHQI